IYEAIEVEKKGLEVTYKKTAEFNIPEEFQKVLDEMADVKAAFEALTPGRQRGYLLHFSQPKQSKTRESRIEKCIPLIFEGKGWNER
ncbi:MAG: YdeI/OmpD-associated family protein, partial [Fulvivirga sp.]